MKKMLSLILVIGILFTCVCGLAENSGKKALMTMMPKISKLISTLNSAMSEGKSVEYSDETHPSAVKKTKVRLENARLVELADTFVNTAIGIANIENPLPENFFSKVIPGNTGADVVVLTNKSGMPVYLRAVGDNDVFTAEYNVSGTRYTLNCEMQGIGSITGECVKDDEIIEGQLIARLTGDTNVAYRLVVQKDADDGEIALYMQTENGEVEIASTNF